jgi:hypothetical protein
MDEFDIDQINAVLEILYNTATQVAAHNLPLFPHPPPPLQKTHTLFNASFNITIHFRNTLQVSKQLQTYNYVL